MAQTVKINGVTYADVKALQAPLASDPTQLVVYPNTEDGTLNAARMPQGMRGYSKGAAVIGTAAENGVVDQVLDASTPAYAVPAGFTEGGTVKIVPEVKSVTPTKEAQTVTPEAGKVLAQVSVAAIPAAYQDVSGVTAGADDVAVGKKIVLPDGTPVEGTHTDPSFALANGVLTIM